MIRQAYTAGAYSNPHHDGVRANIERALIAAVELTRKGYFVICPHAGASHRMTWTEAMDRCYQTIRELRPGRDILVMLPGWEESEGAVRERLLAIKLGVEVVSLDEALR